MEKEEKEEKAVVRGVVEAEMVAAGAAAAVAAG